MENLGWIKLHRKVLDSALARKPEYAWLWINLLLRANHKDHEFIWNGEKKICKRGQLYTSRILLHNYTGISQSTIENILRYLENEQQIEQQKTTKFRLITIINYDQYQQVEQQNGQQSDNRVTTDGQQSDTNNNEKNVKNEKNEEKVFANANSETLEKKEYGNPEINKLLKAIKLKVGCTDFKESKHQQRIWGNHLYQLMQKISVQEFARRIDFLLADNFKAKNCGSLQFIYREIKGFVEQSSESRGAFIS